MALSSTTFSDAGGAVSDLFGAFGAQQQGKISAQATRLKAQGDLAEAGQYDLAGELATKNEQYTEISTAIQEAQQARETTIQIGGEKAGIAGAGFAESGSGLDILADSARQGALANATLGQQGLIQEAAYTEQATSYQNMAATARSTAQGEFEIANEQNNAGNTSAIGDIAGSLLKGAGSISSLFSGGGTAAAAGSEGSSAIASSLGLGEGISDADLIASLALV